MPVVNLVFHTFHIKIPPQHISELCGSEVMPVDITFDEDGNVMQPIDVCRRGPCHKVRFNSLWLWMLTHLSVVFSSLQRVTMADLVVFELRRAESSVASAKSLIADDTDGLGKSDRRQRLSCGLCAGSTSSRAETCGTGSSTRVLSSWQTSMEECSPVSPLSPHRGRDATRILK